MSVPKTLVVIPTYNCKNQILALLSDILRIPTPNGVCFWIVDNLSSDGTFELTSKFIKEQSAENIHSFQAVQNNNLGGTHKIAFNQAIEAGYDYVGILHGDNQANYLDLLKFLSLSSSNKQDKSYLGSRFSRESKLIGYSKMRIIGNIILNLLYSISKRRKLVDLGSGLNLYCVENLKELDYLSFSDSLTFNYELILAMIDSKTPFEYVPIEWRDIDQVSSAKNVRVFAKGVGILMANLCPLKISSPSPTKIYNVVRN